MNIWLRRTYLIITVILFFILAPLLLFYAAGWRYNVALHKVEKVGALLVSTDPKGASAALSQKRLAKKTPLAINNLLPGQYQLILSKTGFWPWEKNQTISEGQLTNVGTIDLLKKQTVTAPLSKLVFSVISQSPDKQKIAVLSNRTFSVMNVPDLTLIAQFPAPDQIKSIYWSNQSDRLVIQLGDGLHTLIDLTAPQSEAALENLFGLEYQLVQWSDTENDILFALATDQTLYRLNVFQKTKTIIKQNSTVVHVANNLFFEQTNNMLIIRDGSGTIVHNLAVVPDSQFVFFPTFKTFIPFIETASHTLRLFDMQHNILTTVTETATGFEWNDQQNVILLYNPHEIWSWDWTTGQKDLVLRTSENIMLAHWLANAQYIIYAPKDAGLKIIETKGPARNAYAQPMQNVTDLLSAGDKNSRSFYAITQGQLYRLDF